MYQITLKTDCLINREIGFYMNAFISKLSVFKVASIATLFTNLGNRGTYNNPNAKLIPIYHGTYAELNGI